MKDFTLYPEALALRELGFDEPCFAFFQVEYAESKPTMVDDEHEYRITGYRTCKNSEIPQHYTSAPTYSQAFRFFREKYNLHAEPYTANMGAIEYCFLIRDLYSEKYVYDNFVGAGASYGGTFDTPEEAELACLKKLIEIVKNKAI